MAEQRQQICASHFSHPDCRGYLLKLDGLNRTWKKRYCILADACLFIYVDSDSSSAYGKPTVMHGRAWSWCYDAFTTDKYLNGSL